MPSAEALARQRRALTTFIVTLLIFLVVFDAFIVWQQRQSLLDELEGHTRQEFELLGELTSAALTQGNYAVVEQALSTWGNLNRSILEARLVAANGFVMAEYESEQTSRQTEFFKGHIAYGSGKQARIEVLKDMAPTNVVIQRLALWLFGFSGLLISLLGVFQHQFAIKPLQQEISEHLQTEQRLREHTLELQEVNQELESFNYSLSHDLRTPLRAITSYSQIISDEDGDRLCEESRRFFARIVETSKHMALLIDDILALSQVARVQMTAEPVDLSKLAEQVADDQRTALSQHAICEIQPGLVALGNKKLLTLLLDNLLGNAIKFSSKETHPEVRFGSEQHDGETVYTVSDNGVGFDMRYADKVFEPFQRLHDQELFEGTGIGAATAKRIVNRHNGRIWVNSRPGVGTTFYFTLGLESEPAASAAR